MAVNLNTGAQKDYQSVGFESRDPGKLDTAKIGSEGPDKVQPSQSQLMCKGACMEAIKKAEALKSEIAGIGGGLKAPEKYPSGSPETTATEESGKSGDADKADGKPDDRSDKAKLREKLGKDANDVDLSKLTGRQLKDALKDLEAGKSPKDVIANIKKQCDEAGSAKGKKAEGKKAPAEGQPAAEAQPAAAAVAPQSLSGSGAHPKPA